MTHYFPDIFFSSKTVRKRQNGVTAFLKFFLYSANFSRRNQGNCFYSHAGEVLGRKTFDTHLSPSAGDHLKEYLDSINGKYVKGRV